MTASKIEDMERARRATEAQTKQLQNYVDSNVRLSHAAHSDSSASSARRNNGLARVAAESLLAQQVESEDRDRMQKRLVGDQNAALAASISRRNAEQERMERDIQRVCDTSEELKELERKLNVAYVNKERAAQYQEGLLMKQLELAREMAIDDQMEYERQKFIKKEVDKDNSRREQMISQKAVLQKQILDRQVLAVEAREEAARDKEMVEQIVSKISEQDRLEKEERDKKKEETRQLVKYFQAERERKKAQIYEESRNQEAEIKAYYDKLAARMKAEDDKKKEDAAEKKRRWAKVVEETKQQNQSKEEFNILRDMLWEEELEAKRIADDKTRVLRREADKKQMMEENQKQLTAKKVLIAQMEAEEERIVKIMLGKFAQDEENERKKQAGRKEMKDSYIHNIKGQREQRAALYEAEKQKELAERDYAGEMEDYRLRVVAEARKRLLQQHAAVLKGFLPKGAIQNEEEAEIVRRAEDRSNHMGRNPLKISAKSAYPDTQQYAALKKV